MDKSQTTDQARPFQFVKFLSWSFFVLILGASLFLSILVSNYAENILLKKQEDFARLLASNLNHQIYRRFILPSVLGYGSVDLSNKDQYGRLEQLVEYTVHGFEVSKVRIFDLKMSMSFSTVTTEVGSDKLAGRFVKKVAETGQAEFVIENTIPPLVGFFDFHPGPGSVLMRTVTPLRAEDRLANEDNPVIGIMEVTQDITGDYETVQNFQRIIVLVSFLTALALFYVMRVIIRRADRVNLERIQEKARLERELHQQEKLAGMGRMVAGVAHEIRNPLGIISSSAELLMKKAARDNSRDAQILQAIFDESKRLSRTVGDFLDYARPKKPRMDRVDLAQVLGQVAVFLEREGESKGVAIKRDFEPGLAIMGDKDLLYRAMYNVVSNALQSIAESEAPRGTVTIRARREGDRILVRVRDTGPGISEENAARILDPFFTTKDSGTGLGLAITSTIVESHNAKMTLSNAEGGGAEAVMDFPAAKEG